MKIAFNPSNSDKNILDLIKNNKDIIFDLKGHSIFARGVEFKGTDTWRDIKINNVSIDSNILDLRNGSNTTLTNTNGVVTINSTWRPVVDNLTSDSTTSSLSANQGRVLAGLINGKSDSEHNHDDRYLRLTGGTMQLGGGLKFHSDNNYFGTDSDARIISLLDGNSKICDGGLIIDERCTLDGKEYVTELLRIRDSEFKWKGSNILHSGNSNINGSTITINGSSLTVSKSDHTHDYLVVNRASESTLNSAYHNFQVLFAGGSNGLSGKPSGVDAFGLIRLRAADGYSGQMLLANKGSLYIRSGEDSSLNNKLAWRQIIDSTTIGSQIVKGAYMTPLTLDLKKLISSGYLASDYTNRYNTQEYMKAAAKYLQKNYSNQSVFGTMVPNSQGFFTANIYNNGFNSNGNPEHITIHYYPHGGDIINCGTTFGSWYYNQVSTDGHTHSWQSITDKLAGGNEFNIVNAGYNNTLAINYLPIDNRNGSATITQYNIYNGNKGLASVYAKRFKVDGQSCMWRDARNYAPFYATFNGGFEPILDIKTKGGDWSIGSYDAFGNHLVFAFTSDSDFNAGRNGTAQYYLTAGGEFKINTLILAGSTNANMGVGSTNPQIIFSENSIQQVALTYTDWDSYRTSKGLKVHSYDGSDDSNVWFEVQGYNYSSGYVKNGSSDAYVLLGGGGHKPLSEFQLGSGSYLPYNGWWASGNGLDVNNANGMIFAYANHKNSPFSSAWGIITTFDYTYNSAYKFQLAANGYSNAMYYRSRSNDRGGWTSWAQVIDTGNIGSQTVDKSYHLRVNHSVSTNSTWSTWYWLGQSGQPTWLWGCNDGTNCYVWNPSNFSVKYATSAGSVAWANVTGKPTIPNPTNYYWANIKVSASSNTQTQPSVNTIYANNWFRSQGNSGWFSESYGGGIYMVDTSWIRTYNGKGFYCDNQIYSSDSIRMNSIYLHHYNEINNADNGKLHLNYRNTGNVTICNGGGAVTIGSTTDDIGGNKLYVSGSEFIDGASNVRNHVFADGFRHRSHNSNDSVLLAGGGYSQGVPVRYWAIYYVYIGNSSTDVTYTKRSGNYNFIISKTWESEGVVILEINFPSGYNKNNTLIFGNGDHRTSSSWKTPVYVTITTSPQFGQESKIRVMISDDASLNTGFANIYFMCMG